MKNYDSDYYLLDIWDHGGGYFGACWDESSGHHLTPHDIEVAISQAEQKVRKRISIVGFDACLMGMIEVCYELKDVTEVRTKISERARVEDKVLPFTLRRVR